jgi:hypothetical protein
MATFVMRPPYIPFGIFFKVEIFALETFQNLRESLPPFERAVAQLGSALEWGSRGRRFESCQPDHFKLLENSDLWKTFKTGDHADTLLVGLSAKKWGRGHLLWFWLTALSDDAQAVVVEVSEAGSPRRL